MKSITLFLAYRYLWARKKEHTISIMLSIAFFSIFIGAFSLALITAIMNGFETTIYKKMQGIHPEATINSPFNPIAYNAVADVINQEFSEVTAISPQAIGHVLVNDAPHDSESQPIVTQLKGIIPSAEEKTSSIGDKTASRQSLSHVLKNNQILIGKSLAHTLAIEKGDPLTLYYLEPGTNKKKITVEHINTIVGDVFETGIDEYDSNVIYVTLPFFKEIFPDVGIHQIGIRFNPTISQQEVIEKLSKRFALPISTWQDLYPALVSALTLEKYAMFFILSLITIVAAMNIIALIFMLTIYKQTDIAILRVLGMSFSAIQKLFVSMGVSLSCIATLCGLIGAWLASIFLERYPFIQLPDAYYVSHLPAHMTLNILLTVFILVLVITSFASWLATQRIKNMNISHILRFEG